ncbi:MAG: T9SS type A sorting domain-containing protein [Bacteroidetes bacterium]|nr:MAG: T9SS type A sorting domain-containing protein [Bacteroidota bacterium]
MLYLRYFTRAGLLFLLAAVFILNNSIAQKVYKISPYSFNKTYKGYIINNYIFISSGINLTCTGKLVSQYEKKISGNEKSCKKSSAEVQKGDTPKVLIAPKDLPGVQFGYSYYDLQSNASMSNRLAYYDYDGSKYLQAFWMADEDGLNGWPTRGTFYDVIDINNPDNFSPASLWVSRIENIRTGWCTMLQFKDGHAATPSHNPLDGDGDMKFTYNSTFGGSDWKTIIANPDRTLWPRAALDEKEYVHMIYTYDTANQVKNGQVGYKRSKDKGLTWEAEKLFTSADAFDGNMPDGTGADSYAIDSRDNLVAVAYRDGESNFVYRKSTDNGDTWAQPTVIFSPGHQIYYQLYNNGDGTVGFASDTVPTPGEQCDVIIDSQGRIHFVINIIPTYIHGNGRIENDQLVRIDDDTTYQSGSYFYYGLAYQYEGSQQPIMLFASPFKTSEPPPNTNASRYPFFFGHGFSRYPQLGLDENDNIYCAYSGIKGDDYLSMFVSTDSDDNPDQNIDLYYGHIYLTHKLNANDRGWSDPKDITPNAADCLFPSMLDEVIDGRMYFAYQADGTPGIHVSDLEIPQEMNYIMAAQYKVSDLNPSPIVGVEDNNNNIGTLYFNTIYPNPADNKVEVNFNIPASSKYEITISDLMGRAMKNIISGIGSEGLQSVKLNTADLPQGAYYCTINSNGQRATKIITIVR